jgi:hypothetical protein
MEHSFWLRDIYKKGMGFVPTGHRPIKSQHFYQAGIMVFLSGQRGWEDLARAFSPATSRKVSEGVRQNKQYRSTRLCREIKNSYGIDGHV